MDNDSNSFINLRGDYGSIWDGRITVRNCLWRTKCVNLSVLSAYNQNDHDYGYSCMMGNDIIVENLIVTNSENGDNTPKRLAILGEYDKGADPNVNTHPYIPAKSLTLNNISVEGNVGYTVTEYPEKYKDLKVKIY